MSRAINTPAFVWHCTAGFALVPAIESYWHRPTSQGGLGWNAKGYAVIIERDGTRWYLHRNTNRIGGYETTYTDQAFEFVTNGVRGFNSGIVNVAYIGGVTNLGTAQAPRWVATDTRTPEQKASALELTMEYIDWLKRNGGDPSKLQIDGHYHYSKDKNRNGIIDSWERIKECPSFDAWEEYRWIIQTSCNPGNILPNP